MSPNKITYNSRFGSNRYKAPSTLACKTGFELKEKENE